MFIGDEVRAEASPAAAATRLVGLARGSSLTRASHAAWDTGTAATGQAPPAPELPRLVRVRYLGPAQRESVSVLILRWEAADVSGRAFPALDADITLVPAGEHMVLVSLAGVYRVPPGTQPNGPAAQMIAAATIHALLSRIAGAISDPLTEAGHTAQNFAPKGYQTGLS